MKKRLNNHAGKRTNKMTAKSEEEQSWLQKNSAASKTTVDKNIKKIYGNAKNVLEGVVDTYATIEQRIVPHHKKKGHNGGEDRLSSEQARNISRNEQSIHSNSDPFFHNRGCKDATNRKNDRMTTTSISFNSSSHGAVIQCDSTGIPPGALETIHQTPPSDEILQSMEIVVDKQLAGISSIDLLYDRTWKEDSSQPFYEQWLRDDGKYDVSVGNWEYSTPSQGSIDISSSYNTRQKSNSKGTSDSQQLSHFIGDWDNENYSQRRMVTYKYKRDPKALGYSLGKPEATVKQTHYFRKEQVNHGEDGETDNRSGEKEGSSNTSYSRSVLSMTIEVNGEPCGHCFKVQIRGVATQSSYGGIVYVEFGMFIHFHKQVIIANKIKEMTTIQTTKAMLELFNRMKLVCDATEIQRYQVKFVENDKSLAGSLVTLLGGSEEELEHENKCDFFLLNKQPLTKTLSPCFPFNKREVHYSDDIDKEMHEIRQKLDIVLVLPSTNIGATGTASSSRHDISFVMTEFDTIEEALNHILLRDADVFGADSDYGSSLLISQNDNDFYRMTIGRRPSSVESKFSNRIKSFFTKDISEMLNRRGRKELVAQQNIKKQRKENHPFISNLRDSILKDMNVTIKKVIDGSVSDFYNLFGTTTGKEFYESCLAGAGKSNIDVGEWISYNDNKFAVEKRKNNSSSLFVDQWSGESYEQKRVVTYNYKLTSTEQSIVVGLTNPTVHVTQHQYGYFDVESNKCVFATTTKSKGIWFGDYIETHIRSVVTPCPKFPNQKIFVRTGVFNMFIRSIRMSGKLGAALTRIQTRQQLDLLQKVKAKLSAVQDISSSSLKDQMEKLNTNYNIDNSSPRVTPRLPLLHMCMPWLVKANLYPGSMVATDGGEDLVEQCNRIERKVSAVNGIVDDRETGKPDEDMNFYLSQLMIIRESLDNIIVWHDDHEQQGLNNTIMRQLLKIDEAKITPLVEAGNVN